MNNQIQDLLRELYQADPELKNQEAELIKIINFMLKEKPNTKFDENFRLELRQRLLAKADELKEAKAPKQNFLIKLTMAQSVYALAGAAIIMLVIILPLAYKGPSQDLSGNYLAEIFNSRLSLETLNSNAFGTLGVPASNPSAQSTVAKGLGGGGGYASADKMASGLMPPFVVYDFKFKYQGEEITQPAETMSVLKRVKQNNQLFNDLFKKLNLGLIDANKFSNLKIQYLNLAEDRDGGYVLDINPYEGLVTINLNWNYWQTDPVLDQKPLTLNDVSNDAGFIAMADEFLAKYGIDTSKYGQPEIDQTWRRYYEKTPNKSEYYFPDTITIIYPLIVNGLPVYEEQGNKVGINVAINVKYQKVMSVSNLMTTNFQASDYQAETDINRIKEIALKGGLYTYPTVADANTQIQVNDVTLGTPIPGYMRYWQYSGNTNQEMLVPAYIFPILETTGETPYYKQSIVVPLVKEILDSVSNPIIQPYAEKPVPVEVTPRENIKE
jgi:hypothetical protein